MLLLYLLSLMLLVLPVYQLSPLLPKLLQFQLSHQYQLLDMPHTLVLLLMPFQLVPLV